MSPAFCPILCHGDPTLLQFCWGPGSGSIDDSVFLSTYALTALSACVLKNKTVAIQMFSHGELKSDGTFLH